MVYTEPRPPIIIFPYDCDRDRDRDREKPTLPSDVDCWIETARDHHPQGGDLDCYSYSASAYDDESPHAYIIYLSTLAPILD